MVRILSLALTLLALVVSARLLAADPELERLKAAASAPVAMLAVRKSEYQRHNRDVDQTDFMIDTGAQKYTLRYKTFRGEAARLNGKELSDWSSGYGMVAPHQNWYHNGFVQVELAGVRSDSISSMEGKARVLASAGGRVAFDLVFSNENATVVVRTAALAGRDELFVSVSGRFAAGEDGTLRTTFCGYPHGYQGPFDRWVHRDGAAIGNAGRERQQFPLDLQTAPWLLLADHVLDPEGSKQGLLGLIYDRNALSGAVVLHNRNYAILPAFSGPTGAEQRYVVYTLGPMSWQAARTALSGTDSSAELFAKAFGELPAPFAE